MRTRRLAFLIAALAAGLIWAQARTSSPAGPPPQAAKKAETAPLSASEIHQMIQSEVRLQVHQELMKAGMDGERRLGELRQEINGLRNEIQRLQQSVMMIQSRNP